MQTDGKIGEILEAHRGERHVVVLHDFPDADSISAAYAHRLISAAFSIEVDILYSGEVSHQQNVALVRLLNLDMLCWENALDLTQYQAAIFVDNQGTTVEEIVSGLEASQVPVLLVVDHHQLQARLKPEFLDVRQTGAVATIYAGYLKEGVIEMDTARKEHILAATALMHGILSDTGGFVRAGADDFEAAAYLSRFRDADMLAQIVTQARSKQTMDIIRRALGNRVVVDNYSVSGIGYLRAENRDAIPEAASFLLTEENVHTAIVYGIVEEGQEETLVGSMRTSKFALDPDAFIKEVFGKDAAGHYFGGGKPMAGAFAIPVGFLSGNPTEEYRALTWEVHDAQVKYKILTKIGVGTDAVAGLLGSARRQRAGQTGDRSDQQVQAGTNGSGGRTDR
jgi:nanoRNase/pAp phosphatase (c-di-AMP/oligoRNAs hydrolase)